MAEGFPSVVADRILKLLGSAAMREIGLLRCLHKELSELEEKVSKIRALLPDAADRWSKNAQVKDWLKRVEDVMHEADDLLDGFFTTAMRRRSMHENELVRKVCDFFSAPLASALELRRKVKKINKRLEESYEESRFHSIVIKEDKKTSVGSGQVEGELGTGVMKKQGERTSVASVVTGRTKMSRPFLGEGGLIGREGDKRKIIEILLDSQDEEGVQVLPIVGMGGSGKTVLAQHVFNDETVQKHFEMIIWVAVSQDFVLEEIVKSIIYSAINRIPENLEFEQLMEYGKEVLRGRKYLLVLDDVWKTDFWPSLKSLLEVGATGSRVLVTTRNREVATMLNSLRPYILGSMDLYDSWILFSSRAFPEGEEINPDLERIGREILERCQGLPLAIVTVAGLLRTKTTSEQWSLALKQLQQDTQTQNGAISDALSLSFDDLASRLKHCFAYCGLFPEDYEIDVQALVSMWMSQGFVETSYSGESMEDLVQKYAREFSTRNLFMEVESNEWGYMTKCRIHDLIRELAISVAGNRCATLRPKEDLDTRPLHVSFDFHMDSPWQVPDLVQAKRARTIILPCQLQREIDGRSSKSICDTIISKFKFLRTLDLHNSGVKVLPNSIGKLKHLRYLDLSQNTDIKRLPNSMCKLWNLQTLKLNYCGKLQELPRGIKKLVNLRTLEIDSCHSLTHMPRGLDQLTNLSTLSEFVLGKGTSFFTRERGELGELKKLNNLIGQLKIKNLNLTKDASATKVLSGKQHLRSLVLIWDIVADADVNAMEAADQHKMTLESLEPHSNLRELSLSAYGGVEFPKWLPSHENLVKFSLWSCVKCQRLPPLNHLPHLKVMVLEDMINLEYISDRTENASSTAFFPSLEELRITNLPKLKGWWNGVVNVEDPTFPCLSKLVIEDCPNLTSMPLYPYLEELLVLKNTSWEPLKCTIYGRGLQSRVVAGASSSSPALSPLANLRTLCIVHMPSDYPNMWQSLQSLRSLTLDHLLYIEPLLEELQLAPSLEELHVWRCDNLTGVTRWISNLGSLQKLTIRLCPNLDIPLEKISLITSLQKVEIEDCPQIAPIENLLKSRFSRRNLT